MAVNDFIKVIFHGISTFNGILQLMGCIPYHLIITMLENNNITDKYQKRILYQPLMSLLLLILIVDYFIDGEFQPCPVPILQFPGCIHFDGNFNTIHHGIFPDGYNPFIPPGI